MVLILLLLNLQMGYAGDGPEEALRSLPHHLEVCAGDRLVHAVEVGADVKSDSMPLP